MGTGSIIIVFILVGVFTEELCLVFLSVGWVEEFDILVGMMLAEFVFCFFGAVETDVIETPFHFWRTYGKEASSENDNPN